MIKFCMRKAFKHLFFKEKGSSVGLKVSEPRSTQKEIFEENLKYYFENDTSLIQSGYEHFFPFK